MAEHLKPLSKLDLNGFVMTLSEGDFIILVRFGLEPIGGIPRNDVLTPDFLGCSSAEITCLVMKF